MLSNHRRNLLFRASIVVNVALLLYGALHVSRGPGGAPVEWEPAHLERSLNSIADTAASAGDYRPSAVSTLEVTTPRNLTTPDDKPVRTYDGSGGDRSSPGGGGDNATTTEDRADAEPSEEPLLARLATAVECTDKEFAANIKQRGEFWVLENYVRASHGPLRCFETLTYTTHAGYEFLDNVVPLVSRWLAPVSLAIHSPGGDFERTLASIRHLRECVPGSDLVRRYVTFHIFFSYHHMPATVPKSEEAMRGNASCDTPPPYERGERPYHASKSLLYPVNVARNVARDAALTHYLLPSDIELYPSPSLAAKFLAMLAAAPRHARDSRRVFPISIFEVTANATVPLNKTELQSMLASKQAVPFHKFVCPNCHNIPDSARWMKAKETADMQVFYTGKRIGKYAHWEPIFIGTNQEPYYDERLSWEGKQDKMTQGYVLCVLNYDFSILNNAFLVHKPGIKRYRKDPKRDTFAARQSRLIKRTILPELQRLYGSRKGCLVG